MTGKRKPNPANCDRIADVLMLPVDAVLEAAGHRPDIDGPNTKEEKALLSVYRALPASLRKVVQEFAEFQLQQSRRRGG